MRKRNIMYHYTTKEGLEGIVSSGEVWRSGREVDPNDARYGNGQYVTDIESGSMNKRDLSKQFVRSPK